MEISYFVGFVLNLFFGLYLSSFSLYCFKTARLKKVFLMFLLIGVSFLISSLFYFLWSFSIVSYSDIDFSLISSVLMFFRIVVLMMILSLIFHNNNLLFFLFIYSSVLFSLLFGFSIGNLIFVSSFLIVFLVSLIMYSRHEFQRVGFLGIFYFFMSCVFLLLLFFGYGDVVFITASLNVLFFLFLFELVSTIRKNSKIIVRQGYFKGNNSIVLDFMKYFIFIVVVSNFVFIGTVSIHELGHYGPSKFLGCSYTKIVYERGLPHTEILCQQDSYANFLVSMLGGLLLPIIVSMFFFFSGGQFIHEIGLLIVGFNFLISYQDILDLGFSATFSLFISIIGFLIVIFSIGLLVSSRTQEERFISFTEGHKHFYNKGGKK